MVLSGASKDGNQFQVLTIEERLFFIEIRSYVPENEHETQEQRFRWKMIFRIAKIAVLKTLFGCLIYGIILPNYMGIIISQYKDPY